MKIIVSNPDLDSITKHLEKQVFGYQRGCSISRECNSPQSVRFTAVWSFAFMKLLIYMRSVF